MNKRTGGRERGSIHSFPYGREIVRFLPKRPENTVPLYSVSLSSGVMAKAPLELTHNGKAAGFLVASGRCASNDPVRVTTK